MRRALAALAVLIVVAACGGGGGARPAAPSAKSDDPGAPAPVDPALLAEIAAGLEEVLAAMAQIAGNPDCAAMGVELGQLFDRSQPLFDLARTQGEHPEAAKLLTAEMDARSKRVATLVDAIGPGLARCKGDAGVVAAMSRMPTF